MSATVQEAHASAEQRAAGAEKSVRAIQRELADLEAAVRAQARALKIHICL